MKKEEPKQPLPPTKEIADFKSKLASLQGIQFERLQDYIQALDKLYYQ